MTKKDNKKGRSKKRVEEKESCALSSLKEIEVLSKKNDKILNVFDNSISIPSTYSTPRESIPEIPHNFKDLKQHFNRPHSVPQVQNSKNQIYQATRSSRKGLERQDTPRPRSETPPFSRGESNTIRKRSRFRGKFQEFTSCFSNAIDRNNKSTNSKSQIHHHHLNHRSWSPCSSKSISPRTSIGHYGSIPRSPRGHRLHNCTSPGRECINHKCQKERHKLRFAYLKKLILFMIIININTKSNTLL